MNGPTSQFLKDIPVLPPPPGVRSNFDNPHSLDVDLIAVNAVFLPLMIIAVSIRLYTRIFIAHAPGCDDYGCIGAALSSIVHTIVMLYSIRYGYGAHLWDIRAITLMDPSHTRVIVSLSTTYVIAIFLTKLSICLLYLRIFGIHKIFSVFVKAGIWFGVVYYAASLGLGIAQLVKCATPSALQDSLCMQTQNLTLWQSVLNVTTDLYLLVLPLAPVSQLQMRRRRKFGVLLIFLSGFVALAVSIARMISIGVRRKSHDTLYYAAISSSLSAVEINVAIIAASMFAMPQFFGKVKIFSGSSFVALRYRLLNYRTKSKSSSGQSPGANKSDERLPVVETNVLGSMQGNGKFMPTNALDSAVRPLHMSENVDGRYATRRDEWERLA